MTRDQAIVALFRAPKRTLKYHGSGFGNRLAATLSQNGIIELKEEWGPSCTMKLTSWGAVLAEELLSWVSLRADRRAKITNHATGPEYPRGVRGLGVARSPQR